METTYRLNTKELGETFINSLKYTYLDQDVEIMVRERDETEYLCNSPLPTVNIWKMRYQILNHL